MKTVDILFGVILTIAVFGVIGYLGYGFYQITLEVFSTFNLYPEPFLP